MIPLLIRQSAPCAALALLLVTAPGQAQTQEASRALHARALAATCANCHGTEGTSVQGEAMVPLRGLPKAHIVTALTAYKDGKRPATVMHQLAKGFSAEQIDQIATYFSAKQ